MRPGCAWMNAEPLREETRLMPEETYDDMLQRVHGYFQECHEDITAQFADWRSGLPEVPSLWFDFARTTFLEWLDDLEGEECAKFTGARQAWETCLCFAL